MSAGKLVVFEGIDGSGKTTQLELLAIRLEQAGVQVVRTRQPTSEYRQNPQVRAYLEGGDASIGMTALCNLAAADRHRHLQETVLPALRDGKWVLCDRYVYSSFAFFFARGIQIARVQEVNKGVRQPDLSILFDIAPEDARCRVLKREGAISKFEEKDIPFMATVRETFLKMRDLSFYTVDATLAPEALHKGICDQVNARFHIEI